MLRTVLAFCLLTLANGIVQADETSVAQTLQSRVRAFHADAPKEDFKLRVIYFYPADRQPQANYKERVNRMVLDIKDFYDTEFERIGLTNSPLPVEMDGDEVKIHMVQGAENHDGYGYDGSYGRKILGEIGHQLRGTVDPDREFLLILCALCDKQEDGRYKIYSPYYGLGGANQVRGICFAADCEMLDTLNLTKTKELFRYNEHNRDQQRSLADFNTVFIGGMAHELGHGLSLPHNRQLPSEESKGTALMGSGNYTYRAELVGKKGSFMTLASATRMMCHPLLTQSNKQRFERTTIDIPTIEFTGFGKALTVRGRVTSNVEPFAVIAYSDAEGGNNYDAYQWTSEVKPDGSFEVTLDVHKPGNNTLRLSFCHANGATSDVSYQFTANAQGEPNIQALQDGLVIASFDQAMLSGRISEARQSAQQYLEKFPMTELKPMLEFIETFDADAKPEKLSQIKGNNIFLSDVEATGNRVGYGRPSRNSFLPMKSRQGGGFFLRPGEQFHAHGLYAHAPSQITYDLNGEWKHFTAVAGMQAGARGSASAIFIVKGDGKELYRSDKLRSTNTEDIDIDVTGIQQLELITETGEKDNRGCWSIWGSPKLTR